MTGRLPGLSTAPWNFPDWSAADATWETYTCRRLFGPPSGARACAEGRAEGS